LQVHENGERTNLPPTTPSISGGAKSPLGVRVRIGARGGSAARKFRTVGNASIVSRQRSESRYLPRSAS
jgi:hypothetical protein